MPRTMSAMHPSLARFAGSPMASRRPWPASRAMCAGVMDILVATPNQSNAPELIMVSITTPSAVSKPSMPDAASAKACSLSWRACGA